MFSLFIKEEKKNCQVGGYSHFYGPPAKTLQNKAKWSFRKVFTYIAELIHFKTKLDKNGYEDGAVDSTSMTLCACHNWINTHTHNADYSHLSQAKVLNSTSALITWRHTSKKLLVNFYTIRIENIKYVWAPPPTVEEEPGWKSGVDFEAGERSVHSPEPPHFGEEAYALVSANTQAVSK